MSTTKQTKLTAEDTQQLTDFFGEHSTAIERSSFGAQLDRANGLASGCRTCVACSGTRWVKTKVAVCNHCDRGWSKPLREGEPLENRTRCRYCKGRRVLELRGEDPREGITFDEICEACSGWGVVARNGHKLMSPGDRADALEVRSTGSSKHGGAQSEPDVPPPTGYHEAARRLLLLSDADLTVLGLYYGIGAAWQKHHTISDAWRGRHPIPRAYGHAQLWPVLAVTVQGRKLVKRHCERRPKGLPGRMLAESAWAEELGADGEYSDRLELQAEVTPDNPRTFPEWREMTQPEILHELRDLDSIADEVWGAAIAEAVELITAAESAWLETVHRKRKRTTPHESTAKKIRNRLSLVSTRMNYAVRPMSPLVAVGGERG